MTTAAITRSPSSFFVYPLLALIHADGEKRRVWYSGVYNATSRYRENIQHDAPCMVICPECSGAAEKWKDYSVSGGNISKHGGIVILLDAGESSMILCEITRGPAGFERRF